MEKRKVLFVVHQLNHGGVQKALISALNTIDYTKNEVTLYVCKDRVQLLADVNKNVKQVIINKDQTHYYRKPYAAFLVLLKQICRLLKLKTISELIQKNLVTYINEAQMKYAKSKYFAKQEEYDVAVSYIQGYTAKFVAKYIKAKKKVMFFQGSMDENHELHEEIMPYFDYVAGTNPSIQSVLKELYPTFAHKITFLDIYVDVEDVRNKSNEFKIDKADGKIILCSCGRIATVKGFDIAVEAAKILKDKNIDFFWYFVGDGPERARLEKKIDEYELNGNIHITGMQDNPYPYIGQCDIYVQPSFGEAFGITIAEAKMLNRAIVSTNTVGGSLQIQHEKNGLLTEINSWGIAEAIIRYKKDSYLKNSIIENLKKIDYREEFEHIQLQWEKMFEGKNEV